MKMQLIKFKCAKCGSQFKAPDLSFYSYGEFLLRSIGNADEVYLNAMEDRVYQEVNALLKVNPRVSERKPNALAEVLRKAFGMIACDPDYAGQPFQIGAFPKCTSCGAQEMDCWEATEPAEFVERNLPLATHVAWAALSDADKEERADSVLAQLGY
ncbi:hypothetical protein D9M69_383140 [compost metagenome]